MTIALPYIHQCAPQVSASTMIAIIKTESKGNQLAIGLNKGHKLLYQPKTYSQAVAWVNYLEKHHYNFDVGIAQVNINNIHKYGLTGAQALDICTNLKLASIILQNNYKLALNNSKGSQEALLKAISAYNSGNYHTGFNNGYVSKVIHNAVGYSFNN